MSSEPLIRHLSVADAKRDFSDVLGAVRHRGERFIIERNGTPMAAIVPVSEVQPGAAGSEPRGFLALVGRFGDAPEYAEILDEIVRARADERSRPVPDLTE